MSTETSSPAQSANVEQIEQAPIQDLLAEKTLAMIGGAPRVEVARLETEAAAQVEKAKAEAAMAEIEAPPLTEQPEEQSDPEPPTEETETETPTGDKPKETEVPTAKEGKTQERFRFKDSEDQAILQIAKAKGISVSAAAKFFAGEQEPAKVEQNQTAAAPEPYVSQTTSDLQAKSDQIAQELQAFEDDENNRDGALIPSRILKLQRELVTVTSQLNSALRDDHRANAEAESIRARQSEVWEATVKAYPDLADARSPLYRMVARLADEAHNPASPDHQAGQQPDAPRYFADQAAELLKIKPGKAAPATAASAAPTTQPPAPKPGPASGSRQTLPPTAAPTTQQKIADIQARTLAMIGGEKGNGQGDRDDTTILVL